MKKVGLQVVQDIICVFSEKKIVNKMIAKWEHVADWACEICGTL